MKKTVVFLVLGLPACNFDAGECYVPGQEGEGAGGGVIISSGAGGFGDVPPEPQNAPDDFDPCSTRTAECKVNWKAGSDVCKSHGTTGACTTLYQGEHATLDEAKDRCEKAYGVGNDSGAQSCGPCQWERGAKGDPVEECKKLCDKANLDCIAACPKGDKGCMNECNQKNGKCLKDCEK